MICERCKREMKKTELKDVYECLACNSVEEVVEEEETKCQNQQ